MVSSIVAALGALYLGLTFEEPGRRPPLTIFACLWLYFSSAAWLAACRRDFRTHARFVIRSYGVALAFVLVRILGQLDPIILAFMPNEDLRGVTREWLSFVIPMLIIEASLTWMPASRATRGHPNKAAVNPVRAAGEVQPRG